MKKILFTLIIGCSLYNASAQTEPQYSLYMFTKQALNPGSIGSRGTLSINTDYRNQWTQVNGAPETFNAGLQVAPASGAEIGRHAGGILLYHDKIGVSKTTAAMLQYAYRLQVSANTMLSCGIQGGLFNYTNNLYQLKGGDANDPVQTDGVNSNLTLNMGAGLYLYSEKFYAGLSVPQLFVTGKDLRENKNRVIKRHYFFMAGYLQPVNDVLKLRLNAMVKHVYLESFNSPTVADFNLSAIFFDRLLAGISYRTENTITGIAQIQLTRTLNLGYAYDFASGNYTSVAGPSHEIFLGFDLNSLKGPFTTPRFVSYF